MQKSERSWWRKAFRWEQGRQETGYAKMLLFTGVWPLKFDSYILKYPDGAFIPPHTDPVKTGRHYRLNIVLKNAPQGGEFICGNPIFESKRIKFFRPDACEHSLTKVQGGSRYVLSIGWIKK